METQLTNKDKWFLQTVGLNPKAKAFVSKKELIEKEFYKKKEEEFIKYNPWIFE